MGQIRYDIASRSDTEPFRVLYVSVSRYDHTWHSIEHTHANAELFYCVSGEGRFRVDSEDIPVRADDLIVVNPHVAHTEYSLPERKLEYIVLGVQGTEFYAPGGENVSYRSLNYTEIRRELLPYFNDITNEAARKSEHYAEVCQHILRVLLIKLKRHEQFDMEYATPGWFSSTECIAVKRYIDDHYGEPLDLDTLVKRTHLSKFYLAHAFQKEFGVSPINYLMQRRIREAKHLLTHTDHQLSDITQMLGFSSQSYFSQCFHRIVGVTPRAYRTQSRRS